MVNTAYCVTYCVRSMPCRLRGVPAVTDNLAVSGTSWRKRIGRAEELTVQYPFAAELLDFYGHLARFQESLSLLLDRVDRAPGGGFSDPLEADLLLDGSEPFLLMAEKQKAKQPRSWRTALSLASPKASSE